MVGVDVMFSKIITVRMDGERGHQQLCYWPLGSEIVSHHSCLQTLKAGLWSEMILKWSNPARKRWPKRLPGIPAQSLRNGPLHWFLQEEEAQTKNVSICIAANYFGVVLVGYHGCSCLACLKAIS